MQYHLFTGAIKDNEHRWSIFVYKDKDTCVQTWLCDPKYNSFRIIPTKNRDIDIEKRIYILASKQGKYNLPIVWNHKELSEQEALGMFWEERFMNE